MLILRSLHTILLTSLALTAFTVNATETRYVTEDFSTSLRTGPGDNYKVAGTIGAGEKVELLSSSNKYAQITDSRGRTVWIQQDQLTAEPSSKTQVPFLEQRVKELTEKLASVDSDWNKRTSDMRQKVDSSDGVINGLKQENQQLKDELVSAQQKVSDISVQLDDKQRAIIQQWFMYGGGIAGLGLILGLILPYLIPRRKKDRWMN
ncbi:TIGR04211 family SH3 domain-containing protein [Budvicia diplopodorum]|uniref:TIGR04211 family SH3 domain-containing protein n=1 Tax=Budvicia diplopodorum TaxID=1119056 RepID=UPI001357BD96|nr:TIGR04211 family SH3 domain-containing protein [Budvicia diplopodorum]